MTLVDQQDVGQELYRASVEALASYGADNPVVLKQIVGLLRRAVEVTPEDRPARVPMMMTLSSALRRRFELVGEARDLVEALRAGGDAARAVAPDSPDLVNVLLTHWQAALALAQWSGGNENARSALEIARRHLGHPQFSGPQRVGLLVGFSDLLQTRFERDGQLADLEEAIAALREARGLRPEITNLVLLLGMALQAKAQRTPAHESLDELVAVQGDGITEIDEHHELRPDAVTGLVNALLLRYEHFHESADLNAAHEVSRAETGRLGVGRPGWADVAVLQLATLQLRVAKSRGSGDLNALIQLGHELLIAAPARARTLRLQAVLGSALLERSLDGTGAAADLDKSIDLLQEVADEPWAVADLLAALLRRSELRRGEADVERAVGVGTAALATMPEDVLPFIHNHLCVALRIRFERIGVRADLDAAVSHGRAALAGVANVNDDRFAGSASSNLGGALRLMFRWTGRLVHLDESIQLSRAALSQASLSRAERSNELINLCGKLRSRFDYGGGLTYLEEAVAVGRQAFELFPENHPGRPRVLVNLGVALRVRFQARGRPKDLDEAIALGRAAYGADTFHPRRPEWLASLGQALRLRYRVAGNDADLDEALRAGAEAVDGLPSGHPSRPTALQNLSVTFLQRYRYTGARADIDEAIRLMRAVLDETPDGHADRAGSLSVLANGLMARFQRSPTRPDIDEAIGLYRASIALPIGHPGRPMHLANLCGALLSRRIRFDHSSEADLEESIQAGRSAVAETKTEDPSRPDYVANFTMALLEGTSADRDEAIELLREVVEALPAGHPHQASNSMNLGNALERRFSESADPADYTAAIAAYRRGAQLPAGAPQHRAASGLRWASLAAGIGDWTEATTALDAVMSVVPLLVDRRLDPADRRRLLSDIQGLGPLAAHAHLLADGMAPRAERAMAAWQALEAGRGVMLNQALEIRAEADELRQSHPALADRLDALQHLLDADPATSGARGSVIVDAPEDAVPLASVILRRNHAAAELARLLDDIHAQPSFEDFGRPPTTAQMVEAATGGTIVGLVVTGHGATALLLTPSGADYLTLPAVTEEKTAEMAARFLAATSGSQQDPRAIAEVCAWLWDAVAEPILRRLGADQPVNTPPRIWWLPTGPLSGLPIHAAGYHEEPGHSVIDRTVSSYISTVRTLHHARRRGRTFSAADGLVVGINRAPGLPELAFAEAEATAVHQRLRAVRPPMLDSDATCTHVVAELPGANWAHFACHAMGNRAEPADSFLALRDGPLRVRDLSDLPATAAYLVVLSACTTAASSDTLLDEPIHIASALQMLGSTHTIATLWRISDRLSPFLTEDIYEGIAAGVEPAVAVHAAIRGLRANPDVAPTYLWAAHIHFGP